MIFSSSLALLSSVSLHLKTSRTFWLNRAAKKIIWATKRHSTVHVVQRNLTKMFTHPVKTPIIRGIGLLYFLAVFYFSYLQNWKNTCYYNFSKILGGLNRQRLLGNTTLIWDLFRLVFQDNKKKSTGEVVHRNLTNNTHIRGIGLL